MSINLESLKNLDTDKITEKIRKAGIAGAGGAGFTTYKKWERLDDVDYLLVNHQESEPNYYKDKWIGKKYAEELSTLFNILLEKHLQTVVVGAKIEDREKWMSELENSTKSEIYMPEDLPINPRDTAGIIFAYTENKYSYGVENALLKVVSDVVIGKDLPMDHGWIVQNTETLYNIYKAFKNNTPVTDKYIHIDGTNTKHKFLRAPIGCPVLNILETVDISKRDIEEKNLTLLEGGPGWCFKIDKDPAEFGITKATNGILVIGEDMAEKNVNQETRTNLLNQYDWESGNKEKEPTETVFPKYVNIPLITNPEYEGLIKSSSPIVERGKNVNKGEIIAEPVSNSISNTQHSSMDGNITNINNLYIQIQK